ncbi:hypothetical protein QYF36_017148 [Acer negundo]|nr:hypothetical protein QYF36_017148 [Acer negundo]
MSKKKGSEASPCQRSSCGSRKIESVNSNQISDGANEEKSGHLSLKYSALEKAKQRTTRNTNHTPPKAEATSHKNRGDTQLIFLKIVL